ncbi:MAG: hypothetical protein Q9219_002398 [cf. Caloplaca sp. 3 TL-2023]
MDASPNPKVFNLLEEIRRAGESYGQSEPGARDKLLTLAYSLVSAVELPSQTIQRIGWAEPARVTAIKLAVDLKLFETVKAKGNAGTSAGELATASDADSTLVSRIMKHLTAMNVVEEIDADQYTATPFSNALTEPRYRDGIIYNWVKKSLKIKTPTSHDCAGPSFHQMPDYLKSISYRHPTDLADGPFQYAHKTPAIFFHWLYEKPDLAACFNNYMSGYRQGKPSWVDPGFYPVEERLCQGIKEGKEEEEVLLVDVGGGLGHDLQALKDKHPRLPGRLILQDKTEVMDQITYPDPVFEKMPHDFFTPQPVHGARAYHLHSVLHDWDDASCLSILANIVPAMRKGYSKILIHELIVPDRGASWSVTSMDWLMLALGAVKERTEKDWHDMVGRVGLRITGVWTKEEGSESLMECEMVV